MPTRFNLPHINISGRAITRPYQAPRENWGGDRTPRGREEHGRKLQAELAAAFQVLDAARSRDAKLEPPSGTYIEVELRPGSKADDVLERVNDGVLPGATRLAQDSAQKIALFVPDAARPVLEQIIQDYQSGPLTPKQKPPKKDRVEPIDAIRQARLETLWTDDIDQLPSNPQDAMWWEVWCFKGMEAQVLAAAERLGARVAEQDDRLIFPEATVIPVLTNRVTIELMLFATTVGISELRRASATPTFLVEDRDRQLDRAIAFAERIVWPPADAPAVCILDTGVNRGHALIEPALAAADACAVREEWGATDDPVEGHGTMMAGLALHGDLVAPLSDDREIVLAHRLESVRILPPDGFLPTDPKNYGAITQAAASRAEIAAPRRSRVFCMAVTNENVSGSRPTTWSAALDQAAVGRMTGDEMDAPRRLFFVSAGNAPAHIERAKILPSDDHPIEDPAQAWNVLTVGGYTDKATIDDEGYEDWQPFATPGDISPFTRTSVTWPQGRTPFKPEIVMESGNRAINGSQTEVVSVDSLALLTTGADTNGHSLVPFSATSAATAQAARLAAKLSAMYPEMWPETIRALIVHSAEWTETMKEKLDPANKRDACTLLRRFGYGVPSFERAAASAHNHLAIVAQSTITPFKLEDGRRFRDCHFYRLPWPRDVLERMDHDVRLKITLSYFIDPNPGSSSAIDPQRYQSHGLRFDLRRRLETVTQFLERVNPLERDDPKASAEVLPDDDRWRFGPQSISAGSLHCDEWTGPAVELAARDIVCIKPVMGWWRSRGTREECARSTRYALVMSLSAPEIDIDLHTPISTLVERDINVEIQF